MNKLDLSLILPCYNEETHFTESVSRIMRVLDRSGFSYEIIFVDDKSGDNTKELIEKAVGIAASGKSRPRNDPSTGSGQARAIFHKKNMGRGRAVVDGIKEARGKVVGFIDIDLEVSPVYIPQIVDIILSKKADAVIGKRIYRTTFLSIIREILSVGYQTVSNWLLDTGKLDTESGYKFFDRKKIMAVVKKTIHQHWFWDTEITVLALRAGLKIVEEPVLFLRRLDKQSTVKVVRDTIDYIISLWKFRKRINK